MRALLSSSLRRGLVSLVVSHCSALAIAQDQAPQDARTADGRWEVTPTRLAAGTEVRLDAVFDEGFWATAARLSPLRMVEPREGDASVETRVRLAFDPDYFYLAIECVEQPGKVHGRLMARDARLDPDDRVEFWFDPFHTGATGYWFQIGAGGSRGDAQISDFGFRFNKSWDGIWDGRSRVTAEGWAAEVAIPFKTLAFDPAQTTWGFNLTRRRKNGEEDHRWAHPRQSHQFFKLPYGGDLLGIVGVRQGVGLDVVPYVKGTLAADRRVDDHLSRTGDAGGEVFYRLSPSLGLALTANTDFAETEVDERKVNLSRFALFFPEKRDFFLDDAPLFQFGIPGGRGGDGEQVQPFFSRRIGLDSNGEAVPITFGGKVTGRAGPWSVGVLQALLDQSGRIGDEGVGVARVSHDVGAESAIGVIGTVGDPNDTDSSATYGVDARFGNSELFGAGHAGNVWVYWLGTAAEGGDAGDGDAFGMKAEYQSAEWRHAAQVQAIEPGFAPRLGFVRRTDIRDTSWSHTYTWRNPCVGLRRIETRVSARVTTTFAGGKDSWRVAWRPCELRFLDDDQVSYEVEREFERVPDAFTLRDGVDVGAGDYSTTQHRVSLETSEARTLGLRANARVGSLYSGHLAQFGIDPTLYLGRFVQLGGGYQEYRVRLREGRFVTRVIEARVDATFTPDLSWRNLVQFDNDSDDLTVQSRLHWIPEPGTDLYLVAVYGWDRDPLDDGLSPGEQALTMKVVHTLRF